MRTFATLALLGAASAMPLAENDYEFMNFITKYGKSYGTVEEFNFRAAQFAKTAAAIHQINAEQDTHVAAHNKFSDFTHSEYKRMFGLAEAPLKDVNAPLHKVVGTPANNIDWRSSGVVNSVKDQGQCGSCWAFSTTASTESAWAISGRGLISLSEQQLVSCSSAQGNQGCSGGWYFWAWDYMRTNAVETEANYPYTSGAGATGACKVNSSLGVVKVSSYTQVAASSTAIKSAINLKPVSVAIEADTYAFQTYSTGILTTGCGTNIDHAVVAVGYGSNYYIVRNSWGGSWGESGYVRIAMTEGLGTCGINQYVFYPTI